MSDHPAGKHIGVNKAAVWYGREVEGPVAQGRPTAFIDRWPLGPDLVDLTGRIRWREITHVFLTEFFIDFQLFEAQLLPIILTEPDFLITIGTFPSRVEDLLQLHWIQHAGLMVRARMDADWIKHLRPGDQVSIGVPYDLMTWATDDAVRTVPDDYKDDKL